MILKEIIYKESLDEASHASKERIGNSISFAYGFFYRITEKTVDTRLGLQHSTGKYQKLRFIRKGRTLASDSTFRETTG